MSRESRLAKRDGKLKKLAAKRGKLVPQSVKAAERFHAQRFAYVTRELAKKRELAELQRRTAPTES